MDVSDESWRTFAACKDTDPAIFYPDTGDTKTARKAKAICSQCPALLGCLRWAVFTGETDGIFGGLGVDQRRTLARQNRKRGPEQADSAIRRAVAEIRRGETPGITRSRNTDGVTHGKQSTVNRQCPDKVTTGRACKACSARAYITSLKRQHNDYAKRKAAT